MKQNYSLWIGLALLVLVVGAVIFWKTPGTAVAPITGTVSTTTDTTGTVDNTSGTPQKVRTATTGSASVSSTTASVRGTVNPEGATTSYWFEYGTTMSYGSSTPKVSIAGTYLNTTEVGQLTGLKPATPYYFRLAATNAYGTSYGSVYSFITPSK